MVLCDVFAKGGDVSIGERSLTIVVGGVNGIDRTAYSTPRRAMCGTDTKGAVSAA